MAKLTYSVIASSGADPEFPASELNVHSPHTRGWQTPRFCEYPQEIVIELAQVARISQIQLLSHQHKIATRIELFVGSGATLDCAFWTRVGYLSLDPNERSQYQARELKSVYVEAQGLYVKFVTHRCHVNRANLFNQVGIIALNILGQYTAGTHKFEVNLASQDDCINDLAFDFNVDPLAARQIRSLFDAKDAAIEAEDYDAAKQLKATGNKLQAFGGQLAQLEVAKRRAVRDEDYDRAKLLKNEITALRRRLNNALQQCSTFTSNGQLNERLSLDCTTSDVISSPKEIAPGGLIERSKSPATTSTQHRQALHIAATPQLVFNKQRRLIVDGGNDDNTQTHISQSSPDAPCEMPQRLDADDSLLDNQIETMADLEGDVLNHQQPKDSEFLSAADSASHALVALSGLANVSDLPEAEPLNAVNAADAGTDFNVAEISAFLGEYRTRCLFSKNWTLREAVLAKLRLLLDEGTWEQPGDIGHLCNIARLGIQDRIAQVYLTALMLLGDVVEKYMALGFKKADMSTALESPLDAIVAKMSDNQSRLREKAVDALILLSRCQAVGAHHVAGKVIHSLDKKRPPHNKWRPIATRLEFLRRLTQEFGVGNREISLTRSHALGLQPIIAFVETHGCASHTFEEVRTAAKALVVGVFTTVSNAERTKFLEPFLDTLRPKQAEEYRSSINEGLQQTISDDYSNASGAADIQKQTPRADTSSLQLHTATQRARAPAVGCTSLSTEPVCLSCLPSSSPASDVLLSHGEDEQSQLSEDPEEELFRDQIMKQLEQKAFSVQEAYEILKQHFGDTTRGNPVIENVLAEWVKEVGTDMGGGDDLSRDRKLLEVATWLFQ